MRPSQYSDRRRRRSASYVTVQLVREVVLRGGRLEKTNVFGVSDGDLGTRVSTMGCGFATAVLAFASVAVLVDAVLLDLELTKELEEVIKGDNFVLSMKHIKPRKRSRGLLETLFAVDFPGAEHKFSLLLDRQVNRVIVETLEDSRKRSQHFVVDSLHDESSINSLILAVNQTQPGAHATLYIDCTSYGMVALPKTLRDMFSSMRHPKIEVYHERKYPVEIDGHRNIRMVLSRNECPITLDTALKRKFDKIFSGDFREVNDDPNIQSLQADIPYRGDIPMLHQLDDSGILTALNKLITVVNLEVKRCEATTQALEHIRQLIEQCEMCKVRPAPPPPVIASCDSHPPNCFPGVRCLNTVSGPTCGPCPRGYFGNGFRCTPGRTCDDNPCFDGVQCRDTENGAVCDRCPEGYEGDGFTCRRGCTPNFCYPGVQCRLTSGGPECGPCPANYEGNGRNCRRCPSGYESDGRTCRSRDPCLYNACLPGCVPTWTSPRH
ncbi:hypothetical protein JTB14_001131 [Gonioctena quinquepunctata]|nr:hypothetical protein JTB14_001131 [Gonioctena quinquepunctata]